MTNTEPQNQTGQYDQGQVKNPPIERLSDGAVNAKIWRNINKDGQPYYNVTFGRTYTDPNTGQPAETQSFTGTDVLKIQRLAAQTYHAIDRMKAFDREQSPQNNPQQEQQAVDLNNGQHMSQQRDQVMNNAAPNQQNGQQQQYDHQPRNDGPSHGR